MPIDTSIYSRLQPVEVQDPFQAYGRMMSLKNLANAGKLDQIQIREAALREQERAQDLKDDEVVRQLFAETNGDYTQLPELAAGKVSQKRQLALMKQVDDWNKELSARKKEELASDIARMDRLGALAATATDQDSFNRAVVSAFEEGLIPENQMTAWMQKTWNPQTQAEVGQLAAQSASGRQILEAAMKRADEGRKVEDQARENQQFMETTYQTNRTARRMENPPAPQATPVIRTTELGTFLIDPQVPAAKEIRTEDNKPIRSSEAGGEGGAARERFDWSRSQAAKSELNAGRKEHDELQTHEQEQHQLKLRIGEATKALGKAIKDKKDTYTGSDGKQYPATEQQMNSLKLELEGADRKIADLQRRQRNIREQLGVGEFTSQQAPSGTIPLSQMMSGDAARAPSPQPPAPAPAKPAPAKTFPRARLAAFAAANGITEQAAEAELKKQGYALN